MSLVRNLWQTDRGRVAHYLTTVALATFMVVETATLEIATLSLVAAAVLAGVALPFTRDAPFFAPLVVLGAMAVMVDVGGKPLEDTGSPFRARCTCPGTRV